jgi:hypothetical protein
MTIRKLNCYWVRGGPQRHPDWVPKKGTLHREYKTCNLSEAFGFVATEALVQRPNR